MNVSSIRVKKLREDVLSRVPGVCIERARFYTEVYRENEALPVYLKRAIALQRTLENMSIYILDGELIVGNQACAPRTAPVFPEYAVEWIEKELEEKGNFDKRAGDVFHLPEEHKEELLEIIKFWKGKTLYDHCMASMPEEVKTASIIKAIHGDGNMTSGDGHIVVDYEKVLKLGLKGVIKEAEEALSALDLSENDALRKKAFLESIIITLRSAIKFAQRFANLAEDLARGERNPVRAGELMQIARNCRRVPEYPASSFYEAVQSVWFVHLIQQIESNGHSVSLGRLDQYLYPYYEHDIKNNVITRDFAMELLECLWIKLFSIIKIRPTSHSGYGAGYPTYQNVTIGGQTKEGRDAVNVLSYLILESVAGTRLTQPNLSVRLHANTPERFLQKCIEVLKMGFGMPAFKNDEVIIPSLLSRGVSHDDAYNYSMVGCIEVAVPGKWGYRCTGMSFLNMIKVLEMTVYGGKDPRTGHCLLHTKSLTEIQSFEEFWEQWEKQMQYYTKLSIVLDHVADTNLEKLVPDIFTSALVNDCIKRGKTVKEGGAVYDMVSGLQVGIANVANSMAAIKKLVFEEKVLKPEKLIEAMKANFESEEGIEIQKKLLAAPKYGNDDDYVDELAVKAFNTYVKEIVKYKNTRFGRGPIGGIYYPGTSAISSNVPMGAVVGATPDGRKAWTPAAEGASPTQGTDKKGPTAVLKSVSKLPTILITGGNLLNQKFSPDLLEGKERMERFVDLLRTFVALKLWHIQFNIVSSEVLRAAQREPEKYRDLIVRVAGYCAQFVTLDPTTQEDIISRTEQKAV